MMLSDIVDFYCLLIVGYLKIRYFQVIKTLMKRLDVEYILYHAYLNDYVLYKHEYADKEMCPKCGDDRYNKKTKVKHMVLFVRYLGTCLKF